VILHVDDLGMCLGANAAFLDLVSHGYVTCGSVMGPCPWFHEIIDANDGLHLENVEVRL
jgi:chitin disaccharide deacetylase